MKRLIAGVVALVAALGCGSSNGSAASGNGGGGSSPSWCPVCATPKETGKLEASALVELSGLAASHVSPGVFYAENDSGNAPSVFAINETGADLGEFQLVGATNVDWEDIARGPCPAGSCVYVGDIGDNHEDRSSYALYRFTEPETVAKGRHPVSFERFPFKYPDGSHNAETLLIDPMSGEIAVVTKEKSGKSQVYVFPLPIEPGVETTLIAKQKIKPPSGDNRFTGGDVHPASTGVLLRTYSRLFYYAKDPMETIADALDRAPCEVPSAKEKQGEAVAWTQKGDGYVTSSEGQGAPVFSTHCTP